MNNQFAVLLNLKLIEIIKMITILFHNQNDKYLWKLIYVRNMRKKYSKSSYYDDHMMQTNLNKINANLATYEKEMTIKQRLCDENPCAFIKFPKYFFSLSKEIYLMTHLKVLLLRSSNLISLPSEIGLLVNLNILDVSCNYICILPNEIGNLTELISLDVRSNYLCNLPSELKLLTKLNYVSINYNKFRIFPSEICALKNIKQLSMASNKIHNLPTEIGLLTNLKVLSIYDTKVTILPTEISLLNLKEFYANIESDDDSFNAMTPVIELESLDETIGSSENSIPLDTEILDEIISNDKISESSSDTKNDKNNNSCSCYKKIIKIIKKFF